MKSAYVEKYGSPEILMLRDVSKPEIDSNEILVKVHALTVNRTDLAILKGVPYIMRLATGILRPRKKIPGTDFAGEVVVIGSSVTKFKVGDRVYGFDDLGLSSCAEYLSVKETKPILEIPDTMSFEAAAASCEGFHYALNFINKVSLVKDQRVLVNGATGAIGSALVQLCKFYNSEVTAVCRGAHADLIRETGADRIVDYLTEDFTTLNSKFDFVFDAVGKSSFAQCRKILKPDGVYISSEPGYLWENLFLSIRSALIKKGQRVVFPIPLNIIKSLKLSRTLFLSKDFKPIVDRYYDISEIKTAYEYVGGGQKIGNVVIQFKS